MGTSRLFTSQKPNLRKFSAQIFERNVTGRNGRILHACGRDYKFGGEIKQKHSDFIVSEFDLNGIEAEIPSGPEKIPPLPVDISSGVKQVLTKRRWFLRGFESASSDDQFKKILGIEGWENLQNLLSNPSEEDGVKITDFYKQDWVFVIKGMLANRFPHLDTYRQEQEGEGKRKKYVLYARFDSNYLKLREFMTEDTTFKLLRFLRSSYMGESKIATILDDISNAHEVAERLSYVMVHLKVQVDTPQSLIVTWMKKLDYSQIRRYPYVKFCLKKAGRETHSLVTTVQRKTGLGKQDFRFAGTKDKNGITYQWVTVDGISPTEVRKTFSKLHGVRVGNFSWSESHLKLGGLSGNRFQVRVRNLKKSKEEIEVGLEHLRVNGFINYFGRQRFGVEHMNAEIGRCIFQRDFRQAVRILLRPYKSAPTSMIAESWDEALKIFQETENIDKAIDIIPRSERENTPKGRLLVAVKHFGFTDDGCLKAICDMNTLHKNMTVQAYVNEEWNRLVSERVLRSGTYPTISDWVQSDRLESQEQCDQYSMTDLTLPIFGTQFLDNEHARALYDPFAKSAGISLEDFELPRELGITFRGWHRPMFRIPQNLSYNFEEFQDTTHLVLDFRLPPSCYATVMLEGLTGVHEDS